MPTHILLGRPWLLRHPIPVATMVFFDNHSRLLARVDSVNTSLRLNSIDHILSRGEFDRGAFIFGTMLDLTTSSAMRSALTIWRQIQASVSPDINNHIHGFVTPP